MLAIPGLWLFRWLVTLDKSRYPPPTSRFIPRTPLNVSVLLLALMILVSLYATYDILVSLPKIAGLALGIAVYYAAVEALALGRRWLGWGLAAYLALGVGVAGLALVGTDWIAKVPTLTAVTAGLPPIVRGLPGAEAGFQPNEVAGTLLWFVPLTVSLCVAALGQGAGRKARGLELVGWILRFAALVLALLFLAGTLLLTQSRGAILGFVVAIVGMVACLGWYGRGAALLALSSAAWGVWRLGLARLGDILFGGESVEAVGAISLAGRVEIWSRAIYAIQDFPITGMGLNTFRTVVHVLYPLFLISPDHDFGHAHNHFLQAALDLGIPGLVAYVALWITAGLLLVRAWAQTRDPWLRAATLGLGGSLAAHFVFGLADAVALGAKPGLTFWLLLALCVAVWQHAVRPSEAAQEY